VSTTEPHRRDAMAKAAAPYIHPTLAAVAHRHLDADGKPIAPTVIVRIMQPPEPKPQLVPRLVQGSSRTEWSWSEFRACCSNPSGKRSASSPLN
jgi:hypothetical protein